MVSKLPLYTTWLPIMALSKLALLILLSLWMRLFFIVEFKARLKKLLEVANFIAIVDKTIDGQTIQAGDKEVFAFLLDKDT